MRRFHVHLTVENLTHNIDYYSQLFGQPPTKEKSDYAQWLLENPAVNFAISSRGKTFGISHLGMQADNDDDWQELQERARRSGDIFEQSNTTCCYAKSDKAWSKDPQGVAWEYFFTKSQVDDYGVDTSEDLNAISSDGYVEHELSSKNIDSYKSNSNNCRLFARKDNCCS